MKKMITEQNITEIVEDIIFTHSPSYMVNASELRRWYRQHGIKYVMQKTGSTPISYNVETFNWLDIANKKRTLILDYNQLMIEKQYHHENLQSQS
jgi:hypothetical protein